MADSEHPTPPGAPEQPEPDAAGEPIPKGGPSSHRFEGEVVHQHQSEIRPGKKPQHEVAQPSAKP